MPKKGQRTAMLRVASIRVIPDGTGTIIQVLQEARVEGYFSLGMALEEVKEIEEAKATVTVEPGQAGTVPQDSGARLQETVANLSTLPFDPESPPEEKDESFSAVHIRGPIAPLHKPDADADAPQPMLGPKVAHRPDLGDVKKRLRQTQGKGE